MSLLISNKLNVENSAMSATNMYYLLDKTLAVL